MSDWCFRMPAMLVLVSVLTSCASSRTKTVEPTPEPDVTTQTLSRAASLAYRTARYEQAATLFAETLKSAMERDQWSEIVDARFNLALTATALGQYDAAHAQLDLADAEHGRHNGQQDQQIALLRATVYYRSGELSASDKVTGRLLNNKGTLPDIRMRATFIAALIRADQNNIDGLQSYIAALESMVSDANSVGADILELKARRHGLQGDIDGARVLFDAAVSKRRNQQDYRGMVRVLASCARVLERKLPEMAADYYLRAGRSAAQRSDPQARHWLERARLLAGKNGTVAREADELLLLVDSAG